MPGPAQGDLPAARRPSIPENLDEALSTDWITAALDTRFPGIKVTSVTRGPVVSRLSTNARFHIDCAGGVPAGLSPDLCIKGYFTAVGWPVRFTGKPEARFYRDLAAPTGIRTLRSVYSALDPDTDANVIITEDAVAAGGVFLDGRYAYTPEQAADSLAELARLHAATWGDPSLAGAGWLDPRLTGLLAGRGVREIRGNFESWVGAAVPERTRDAERLVSAFRALAEGTRTSPVWSVIHGDPHVGNLYLDGDGRPSFADWQLVQRGPWYLDVGYHIASALTVADRRRTEGDLLRHYLDRLSAAGIAAPSWDDALLGLRRGILYGFYLWGITQLVDPEVTSVLLERLGTAAADHHAFTAVDPIPTP
ncbi:MULTISPECIES: phosphotransferase [unclassified Frankia]|uniref:phosphotransferase n=1 Tax=unclassified Frankia TaxID=2632575 RepID=UPI00200C0052|nr:MULTISPECIES: aminoglycoside phosphotransferase family protein [unclassified Frankia]MCK9894517.1 aminoglycoside phosphotransferase family protein [Frankia sp. AgB32]MCL9793617.1 aminoglycoside phosphotransferase family protein [Frankia sp. AgKG'84/4]